MAALAVTNPTLKDLVNVTDPNGQIAQVVELLTQTNEMLTDMTWVEGNLPTGNVTTVRTGLPSVTWRKLYGVVQPSKSTTTKVTDTCGMLEAYSEVDVALAQLNGMAASFMLQEEMAQVQSMNQEIQRVLIYGNEGTQPEAFTGIMPRYNLSTADNGQNIIMGGGSGTDNASILLVYWHPSTVHGIIPKGSVAGMQRSYKGQVTVETMDGTAGGGRMEAFRTHYRWDAGFTVRDWRSIVRVCNIDKSLLLASAASGADLADLMFQALETVPIAAAIGRPVWYMSRNTLTFLRRQLAAKTATSTLTYEQVGGVRVSSFQGIPIHRVDAMAADEALVA